MNPTFDQTVSFLKDFNTVNYQVRTIEAEIADMIAQMRPDLSEVEVDYCFKDAWDYIQVGGYKSVNTFIASWGRHEEEIL